MDAFLSLKRPGIANKPPPFVTCSLSSGGSCGARGLFPHHPLILMWFYSPALLLSACLWPSVSRLEMYKVKRRVRAGKRQRQWAAQYDSPNRSLPMDTYNECGRRHKPEITEARINPHPPEYSAREFRGG